MYEAIDDANTRLFPFYGPASAPEHIKLMPGLHARFGEDETFVESKFVSRDLANRNGVIMSVTKKVLGARRELKMIAIESSLNVTTFYAALSCKAAGIKLDIAPFSYNVKWDRFRSEDLVINPFGFHQQ